MSRCQHDCRDHEWRSCCRLMEIRQMIRTNTSSSKKTRRMVADAQREASQLAMSGIKTPFQMTAPKAFFSEVISVAVANSHSRKDCPTGSRQSRNGNAEGLSEMSGKGLRLAMAARQEEELRGSGSCQEWIRAAWPCRSPAPRCRSRDPGRTCVLDPSPK